MSDVEVVRVDINTLTYAEAEKFEELAGITLAEFSDRQDKATLDKVKVTRRAKQIAKAESRKVCAADHDAAAEELSAKLVPFYPSAKMLTALTFVTMRRADPDLEWETFRNRPMAQDMGSFELVGDGEADPTDAGS